MCTLNAYKPQMSANILGVFIIFGQTVTGSYVKKIKLVVTYSPNVITDTSCSIVLLPEPSLVAMATAGTAPLTLTTARRDSNPELGGISWLPLACVGGPLLVPGCCWTEGSCTSLTVLMV